MDFPIQTPAQLGAQLKSLRRSKGLTQAQLGAPLGLGQVRIADIESDPGAVSFGQLLQILHLLNARVVLQPGGKSNASSSQSENKEIW
ncbi:MAG: hypothetical protein JWP36_2145 [Paucimonas sp.]|nr:hypothetical protein [Paucimonas sp.]